MNAEAAVFFASKRFVRTTPLESPSAISKVLTASWTDQKDVSTKAAYSAKDDVPKLPYVDALVTEVPPFPSVRLYEPLCVQLLKRD